MNLGPVEGAAPPVLVDSGDIDTDPVEEGGSSLPSPSGDANHPSELPLVPDSNKRALRRLISNTLPQHELPSVIAAVISNVKSTDIVECLQGSDAQTFVDIMDEVCHRAILTPKNRFIDLFQPPNFCRSGIS